MDDHLVRSAEQRSHEPPPGLEETARFETRSVTGARYTIIELSVIAASSPRLSAEPAKCYYRTAWAKLPVAANDDGSFTILPTHTRLVRTGDT